MQRYFALDLQDNHLLLEESDLHHIKNVMRNKPGDQIECVFQKKVYHCQIEDLASNRVEILKEVEEDHELKWDITIAVALVKEQKMDLILQKLTELGVKHILPLEMERSIIKLDQNKWPKKKQRWQKICKEAAEQSKRNDIPEIMDTIPIKKLSTLSFEYQYICSTSNSQNLSYNYLQEHKNCATMIFVIGPEGGISPKEEELLISFGYKPISLGDRIMRVETAAIYTASIINFCSMR